MSRARHHAVDTVAGELGRGCASIARGQHAILVAIDVTDGTEIGGSNASRRCESA